MSGRDMGVLGIMIRFSLTKAGLAIHNNFQGLVLLDLRPFVAIQTYASTCGLCCSF